MKFWWVVEFVRLVVEKFVVEVVVDNENWFELVCWCFYKNMFCVEGVLIVYGYWYLIWLIYFD